MKKETDAEKLMIAIHFHKIIAYIKENKNLLESLLKVDGHYVDLALYVMDKIYDESEEEENAI